MKINKSLERLDASIDGQLLDGFSNFAAGIVNIRQLYDLLNHAVTSDTVIAIGIITSFVLVNVVSLSFYLNTKKRLDELQQDNNRLNNFNQQLDVFYQRIEESENFLKEQFNQ